jgi:DNA-binding transcriptional MerR regulator
MLMNHAMTIQEVTHKTGLSEYTLRYYERIGLIENVDRAVNGHRRYTDSDIGWIELLKCLRATGMPVAQMKQFADLTRAGEHNIDERLALLEAHRCAVLQQIDALKRDLAKVEHKIDYYTKVYEETEHAARTG